MLNKGYSSSSNKEMRNHRKRNVFKNTLDRDISAMKKFVNKKVGLDVAHDLREDNPTHT